MRRRTRDDHTASSDTASLDTASPDGDGRDVLATSGAAPPRNRWPRPDMDRDLQSVNPLNSIHHTDPAAPPTSAEPADLPAERARPRISATMINEVETLSGRSATTRRPGRSPSDGPPGGPDGGVQAIDRPATDRRDLRRIDAGKTESDQQDSDARSERPLPSAAVPSAAILAELLVDVRSAVAPRTAPSVERLDRGAAHGAVPSPPFTSTRTGTTPSAEAVDGPPVPSRPAAATWPRERLRPAPVPDIHVHIDHVTVNPAATPAPRVRANRPAPVATSLDDYLRARTEGRVG